MRFIFKKISSKFYFGNLICVEDNVAWVDIPVIGSCAVNLSPDDYLTERIKVAFNKKIEAKVILIFKDEEYRVIGLKK